MDSNNYYIWFNFKTAEIANDMPKKATIFAPEEFEISYDWQVHDGFSKMKDIDLTLLFGSSHLGYYTGRHNYPPNAKIELWPTYWCNATYREFNIHPKTVTHDNIDKLFISLNNRGYYHRCLMLDHLYHEDLMKYGAITFHEPESPHYQWKYWTPEHLVLDEIYPTIKDSYKTLPVEFSTTLVSLIAESTLQTVFMTEKTWTPMLFAKPFIVFGAHGFHKALKDLGFKLYDELFDYSFDEITNIDERLAAIMVNLKNLAGQDYNLLRAKIAGKAEFNRQHMIKIATSREYIPKLMLDHLATVTDSTAKIRDLFYIGLEKMLIR